MIELVKGLSKYLEQNYNPHTRIIISQDRYDIVQDIQGGPIIKLGGSMPEQVLCCVCRNNKVLVYPKEGYAYVCNGCSTDNPGEDDRFEKGSLEEELFAEGENII